MEPILSADIGGTNSRFAAFAADAQGNLTLLEQTWLKTHQADTFQGILADLRAGTFSYPPDRCSVMVLAVPGPVEENLRVDMANVRWNIDLERDRGALNNANVHLINDFEAQAYACRTEAVRDARRIKDGDADPNGPVGVIGAGTGLGHCSLVPDKHGSYVAVPAEAGHVMSAFMDGEELEYMRFACREFDQPYLTGDDIITGRGLTMLVRFYEGKDLPPDEAAASMTPDTAAFRMYAKFYARACRHYAFNLLPTGGLFISGGVAAKNPVFVDNDHFREEFLLAVKYGEMLRRMPIRLNANEESGLWGGALYGLLSQGFIPGFVD